VESKSRMAANPEHEITGIILVGGKSRRMGQDKAFLKVEGTPIFERVLTVFRESFERILLIGDREERFADYGLPVVPDIYPGSSLGGLYTGLYHAETDYVFVSTCDLPFPNAAVLRYLCSLRDGFDAVVLTTENGYEPLFALYSKNCLVPIKALLDSGDCCAYAYYPQINIRYVPYHELAHLDQDGRAFLNVNTPEEFAKIGGASMTTKVVSFVAKSGTGKTTLLEKVIGCLKEKGYRVGVIKHDAHRFDIDHPGKDSHRLTAAGADTMLISSPEKLALIKKHAESPPLQELLATYFSDVDIVVTEGFKKSSMPKIELNRQERSTTLICRGEENDPTLVAVASDAKLSLDVPVLDLNDPMQVADFIEQKFLK
jgi:molybdopterin-guanine dinucleotide biosynthesis protein